MLVIDVLDNQFSAYCQYTGSFHEGGNVYPYTTIRIITCFYEWQVPDANSIKKIILLYYEGNDEILHEKIIGMEEYQKKREEGNVPETCERCGLTESKWQLKLHDCNPDKNRPFEKKTKTCEKCGATYTLSVHYCSAVNDVVSDK